MKVALTGTPGTGKTTVAELLREKYRVVHLNEFTEARREYDESRDTYVVDIDYLQKKVDEVHEDEVLIVEGHYAQDMHVDIAIVLRCHPDELKRRLKSREYSEMKIMENVEAEAMGIITEECLDLFPEEKVYEVDTTNRSPEEVARAVEEIISGRGDEFRKRISYMEEILKWY